MSFVVFGFDGPIFKKKKTLCVYVFVCVGVCACSQESEEVEEIEGFDCAVF